MSALELDPLPVPALHRLVARWVDGWVVSRPGSTVRALDGGFDVTVAGSPKRTREVVLVDPTPGALHEQAAAATATPGTWLTLVTREPVTSSPPSGFAADLTDELLMTTDLAPPTGSRDPGPGDAEVRVRGGRVAVVLRIDGLVACTGQVGVAGRSATFDKIRTIDAFQRRGLGRQLMEVLTAEAMRRGATHGVLAASRPGQGLYAALGWTAQARMITYARTGRG